MVLVTRNSYIKEVDDRISYTTSTRSRYVLQKRSIKFLPRIHIHQVTQHLGNRFNSSFYPAVRHPRISRISPSRIGDKSRHTRDMDTDDGAGHQSSSFKISGAKCSR